MDVVISDIPIGKRMVNRMIGKQWKNISWDSNLDSQLKITVKVTIQDDNATQLSIRMNQAITDAQKRVVEQKLNDLFKTKSTQKEIEQLFGWDF